jgi:hypothetical protein
MSAVFSDPFPHAAVVTPSNSANLPVNAVALLLIGVAASATLALTTVSGEQVSLNFGASAYTVPILLPIQVQKVFSTGTANISTIVALWH